MLNYAGSKHKPAKEEFVNTLLQNKEIDVKLFSSLVADKTELGPEKVLQDSKYNSMLTPFDLKWTFGFEINVPLFNLSTETKNQIFYASSNVGVVYDYCSKEMTHLKGHQSKIVSATVDRSGRWLATADSGSDNAIMLWDLSNCSLIWTIFNRPPAGKDLLLIALSPNAKLLITISNQNENTIDFWLWTYGKEEPDYSYTDERSLGAPKAINFHPNKEDHIVIVFEKSVLFFCWDYELNKANVPVNPKGPQSSAIGHYSDGTYVDKCHECFVSSSKGSILVFGNTIFAKSYAQDEVDNNKFYVKCIKTNKGQINCITSIDGLIVTGDSCGLIMFFDMRIKLLYWFSRPVSKCIKSISFKLSHRKFEFVHGKSVEEDLITEDTISVKFPDCVDFSDEYQKIILEKMPRMSTIEKKPFIVRDFFITTVDGTIYLKNFSKSQFTPLFPTADSHVAAIDVHDEKPFIVIAYSKNHLVLYNYETHEEVMTGSLPEENDVTISTLKYSGQSLHLACGRSNGELWLLQPIILSQIYVDPFKFGGDKVMKIAFSQNSLQMAYFDSNNTVYAFYYDTESEDWIFKGKVRSHYKEISNILFLDEDPYGLYTIGKDRHLIKYTDLSSTDEEVDILTRDRIEQKDIPVYFTPYPRRKFSKGGYFLIVDDKHKYKIISSRTAMCTAVYLGPAYGCFKDNTIAKMEFLPKSNKKYLIFMTKKHIGLQLMPIDGNPFKYVGCLAHPEELLDFRMSCCGNYVFTIGKNDRSVFMWKIKLTSVETMNILGGTELQPFYCLIEGGRGGFLYQEMRDLFYYMQILQQGEQICAPRIVSNNINMGELPDLMRACGYYPSEYEIENLLTEVRYKDYDDIGILKDKVTFCEFVKLFINHKPAYGYTIESLEEAFETITTFTDEYGSSDMPKEDFVEAITTTGEQVNTEQLYKCLATLMHASVEQEEFGEREFSFLPDSVDFDVLTEDILGLDMSTIERAEATQSEEESGGYYGYYYRP